jgi:hypothetical protein
MPKRRKSFLGKLFHALIVGPKPRTRRPSLRLGQPIGLKRPPRWPKYTRRLP